MLRRSDLSLPVFFMQFSVYLGKLSVIILLFSFLFYSYCVKTLQGHREWVRRVRVNTDGKLLILVRMIE